MEMGWTVGMQREGGDADEGDRVDMQMGGDVMMAPCARQASYERVAWHCFLIAPTLHFLQDQ